MSLMVGLNMRGVDYRKCFLKWGYNEAIDDNGRKLGPCYNPAENGLRVKVGKKLLPSNKGGGFLVWFESEDPEKCIFEKELADELDIHYKGYKMRLDSPRLAAVTPTLYQLFKRKYGIDYLAKSA
jgi:hypothetical protein